MVLFLVFIAQNVFFTKQNQYQTIVSKETSSEPTVVPLRPIDHTKSQEVGSNDFQFGVYKKEIVTSCDEILGDDCVKTCTDTTYVYNGDILISETQGDEYETPCDDA